MKMKINHILLVCFVFFLFSFKSFSEIQKGKWEFIKEQEYCFIQSAPINTVIPEGKQRGEHYMLVYRMHKSPELIIQITAGFDFKTSDSIEVQIDNGSHVFYADEDSAWAKNDEKTIKNHQRQSKNDAQIRKSIKWRPGPQKNNQRGPKNNQKWSRNPSNFDAKRRVQY